MEAMTVPQLTYKIVYSGKDITADISRFLVELEYADRVTGESDTLDITLDDSDGLWVNDWAPAKGDTIACEIGDGLVSVSAGTFTVDEIEYSGPPDTLVIRCIAANTSKALRSRKSKVHEKKTLAQIVNAVAAEHGYQVQGKIEDITLDARVQHRETDLAFLQRLAAEYGYVFSLRNGVITFYDVYELEGSAAAVVLQHSDLVAYRCMKKTVGTYKETKVAYRNTTSNTVVTQTFSGDAAANTDGLLFSTVKSGDTQLIKTRAENDGQALRKAKAAHHSKNSNETTGSFRLGLNPLMLAGVNIEIRQLGVYSGVYQVTESRHRISRNGGETSVDAKKIRNIAASLQTRETAAQIAPQTTVENG